MDKPRTRTAAPVIVAVGMVIGSFLANIWRGMGLALGAAAMLALLGLI